MRVDGMGMKRRQIAQIENEKTPRRVEKHGQNRNLF